VLRALRLPALALRVAWAAKALRLLALSRAAKALRALRALRLPALALRVA
jgi:hypothetical protein